MVNRPLALYPRVLAAMGGDPAREWRLRDLLAADPTLPTKAHLRRVLDWMAKDGVIAARTEYVRGTATTFVRPVPGAALPGPEPEASAGRAGVRLSAIELAPVPKGWRRCCTCRAPKPYDAKHFAVDKRLSSGLTTECRVCCRIRHAEWHAENRAAYHARKLPDPEYRAKVAARQRRYAATEKGRARRRAYVQTPVGKARQNLDHYRYRLKNCVDPDRMMRLVRKIRELEAYIAEAVARREKRKEAV